MSKKEQKLSIEFSEEATKRYLEIARKKTELEVAADCLPSGVTITIEVAPPFGCLAEVDGQDIGEIVLTLL